MRAPVLFIILKSFELAVDVASEPNTHWVVPAFWNSISEWYTPVDAFIINVIVF